MMDWVGSLTKWMVEKLHWLPLGLAPVAAHTINLPFVWPPIGNIDIFLGALTSAIVILVGWLSTNLRTQQVAKRNMKWAVGVAAALSVLYGVLLMSVVVPKENLRHETLYINIGFQRTTLAKTMFPEATPPGELLEYSGLEESQVQKMWTPGSILLAKVLLYLSYLSAMASANYAIGAHTRSRPSKSNP